MSLFWKPEKLFSPFLIIYPLWRSSKRRVVFDEQLIQLLFPTMKIRKTVENMVVVNGIGPGGTTAISAGNALRRDQALKDIGINLDAEFEELYEEIPVTIDHQRRWNKTTQRLFEICTQMDLHPQPLPKMGYYDRCIRCGKCVLGCSQGVKWDTRQFLNLAIQKGARLQPGCRAVKVIIRNGKAAGVEARQGRKTGFLSGRFGDLGCRWSWKLPSFCRTPE